MYCGGLIEFQNSRVGKSDQGTNIAKVLINHVILSKCYRAKKNYIYQGDILTIENANNILA